MRTWLITGISGGLGQALARYVMESGDFVIGTFRQAQQAEAFNEMYHNRGKAHVLNLADSGTIERAVEDILSEHPIDVLVNNAGVGFAGAIEEASMEEIRRVMEVNFFGPLLLTRLLLPHMRKVGKGTIVQVSSHAGVKAFAGFGVYSAGKFALEGFSEALAQEVAPLGIKVLIVEPGPFRTGFAGKGLMEAEKVIPAYNETAGAFRSLLKSVDGKQEGDPDKAAGAIYEAVTNGTDALRLPLGKTPLKTIQMKLDSVKKDLDAGREVAEGVVF